jgi:hypothetical protein
MSHIDLCAQLDAADAALLRRDYVAADRIMDKTYCVDHSLAWFTAGEIGQRIAHSRDEDRRPTVVQPGERMDEEKANFAFIVRCVNSHDALVEALKKIMTYECDDDWPGLVADLRGIAEDALILAGGEQ